MHKWKQKYFKPIGILQFIDILQSLFPEISMRIVAPLSNLETPILLNAS